MCDTQKKDGFVHLHAHTDASVQDALPKAQQLAMRARELGQIAVAKTDHGRMNDTVPFVEACRAEHPTLAPIKPIVGVELYMNQHNDRFDKNMIVLPDGSKKRPHRHLTVLAKNQIGYKNLIDVTSESARLECSYYNPIMDENYLFPRREGLIVMSGCMGSELNQTLLKEGYEAGLVVAKRYKEAFGDDYYIELHYHGMEEQKRLLQDQIRISRVIGSKCVAANDVHYLDPEDWKIHDLLIQMRGLDENSAGGKKNGKKDAYASKQFWLKSELEMSRCFGQFPEALSNTLEISEKVDDYFSLDVAPFLPKATIPTDDPKFNEFYKIRMPYHDPEDAYLAYLTFSGLQRLGLFGKKEYMARAAHELLTVRCMGVTSYFLLQYEMAKFMTSEDILFGIRGSAVGSLIIHALGISDIDPLRWNLLFERFLNPGRGTQFALDLPDLSAKQWRSESGETAPTILEEADARIESIRDEALKTEDLKPHGPEITKEAWVIVNQGLSKYVFDYKDRLTSADRSVCLPPVRNAANSWFAYLLGITGDRPTAGLSVAKYATLPDVDTDIDRSRRQEVIEWARRRYGSDHVAMIGTKGTFQTKASVKAALKVSEKFQARHGLDKVDMMANVITKTIPTRQMPPMTIEDALTESADFRAHMREWPEELETARRLVGLTSHEGVHAAGVLISSVPIKSVAPLNNAKGVVVCAYDMASVERVGLVKYDYLGLAAYEMLSHALKMIEKRHGKKINLGTIPLDDPKVLELYAKGLTSTIFQCASSGMKKSLREVQVSSVPDLVAVISLFRPGPLEYIPAFAAGKKNPEKITYGHELLEKHLGETYKIAVYQEQLMFLFKDMAGFSWQEVDKVRKAVSKKQGKDFEKALSEFEKRALGRGIPESVVGEVLKLVDAFGSYAFNRAHACSYALLSYKTAYMRYYYPAEWIAACMHVDRDDEDKIAVYKRECQLERIRVNPPGVNESGFETTVSKDGVICLPLTSIKGVGALAQSIVAEQPFKSLMDMAVRARPNKGIVSSLAEGGALDVFPELTKFSGTEGIMECWARVLAERDASEREAARAAKMKYKPKIDIFAESSMPERLGDAGSARKLKPVQKSKFLNNPFGLDDSFARGLD